MRKFIGQPIHWMRKRDGRIVCRHCQMERTPEGHDPCLGTLPGVQYACCGHGTRGGYVWFTTNVGIYFDSAYVRWEK